MTNTLILSLHRSRSSVLYKGLEATCNYKHCYYEPGWRPDWFKDTRTPLVNNTASASSLSQVTKNLKWSNVDNEAVLVKELPLSFYVGLHAYADDWNFFFDEIFIINRNFRDMALSYLIAEKSNQWKVFPGQEAKTDSFTYDSVADAFILARVMYNWHTFNHWKMLFKGHKNLITLDYDEVIGYMVDNNIPLDQLKNQSESISNEDRIVNLEDFDKAVESLLPYVHVTL